MSDSNGNYTIPVNCKEGNFIRASKDDYATSEHYVATSWNQDPLKVDFVLEPLTVTAGQGEDLAKILDLKPIYFDFNSANIRQNAEIELQKVIAAMEKYPSLTIDVRSHTDSRGNDSYNLKLSERTAQATIKYIVSKGVDASRITGKGYGETQLINNCSNGASCSKEAHQLNRRSEFIVIN